MNINIYIIILLLFWSNWIKCSKFVCWINYIHLKKKIFRRSFHRYISEAIPIPQYFYVSVISSLRDSVNQSISQSVNQSISVKKIGSRGTKLRKIWTKILLTEYRATLWTVQKQYVLPVLHFEKIPVLVTCKHCIERK